MAGHDATHVRDMMECATTPGGLVFIQGLRAQIEIWKDRMVDANGVERDQLQGVVKHVRDLLTEVERLPRTENPNKPESPTSYG